VKRVVLALALGAVGGALFAFLRVPLAWMLGAMALTTAAAIGGVDIDIPGWMRRLLFAVLGIMLGSAFDPTLLDRVVHWSASLVGVFVYILVIGAAGYLYLRRIGAYDPINAYFTSVPGGLNEMTALGHAFGGDERLISLSHAVRLTLVVFTIPVWFRLVNGYVPAVQPQTGGSFADAGLLDLALFVACAFAGPPLARLARMPAAHLTGPLLLSAGLHMSGATQSRLPPELVVIAQVGLGAALGARFTGLSIRRLLGTMWVALGLAAVMLAGTVLLSLALAPVTGIPLETLLLAYAPGGFAEMGLIALTLELDTAFVATHQLLRVVLVIFLAPLFFRLLPARANVAE
jgi:uncharacterized protein